jgi:3-isopropylmalate/(R)-2-methylmalate dehydratase large subunit
MSFVEKILNRPAGEFVKIVPDWCLINDGSGHRSIDLLDESRGIANPDKVIVVLDHDIPAGSFESAANQKKLIGFSRSNNLEFIQSAGIGYQILLERYVKPGNIVVSCGTHSSYLGAEGVLGLNLGIEDMAELLMEGYLSMKVPESANIRLQGELSAGVSAIDFILKLLSDVGESGFKGLAVEFTGEAVRLLSLNDRIVLCSMISRAGAVSACVKSEQSGTYALTCEYDLNTIQPTVALPGSLYESKPLKELKGVGINAAFIGGCMGSRIEDIRAAAAILRGKRVKLGVRLLVGFASNSVYLQSVEEGLIDIFLESGAQVTNPGCASCQTTSIGVVGDGEVLLTTGSYNYPGCSGTMDSKVYIASGTVVSNAALTGCIF